MGDKGAACNGRLAKTTSRRDAAAMMISFGFFPTDVSSGGFPAGTTALG